MIYKIIHKDFEINLLDKNIDYTEQNQWFVDGVSINFTLPISIILTKELDKVFNMISHLNSYVESTTFDVKIYKMETSYEAVLSIEKITGLQIDLSFKYGFDEYPNFSKELRSLPLEDKDVFGLRQDANSLSDIYWPNTNYKYPAVLVPQDILDNDLGRFDAFEGVINLFESGVFVENTFDTETNIASNRTVLQPFPYLLHVLKVGFEDAGFTLSGDVLADQKLQKLLFGKLAEYYINFSGNQQEISISTLDLNPFIDVDTGNESYGKDHNDGGIVVNIDWFVLPIAIQNLLLNQGGFSALSIEGWYYHTLELSEPGKYILAGNVTLLDDATIDADVRIYIGDNLLYSMNNDRNSVPLRKFETISIEFNLVTTTPTLLKIYGISCFTFEEGALETQSTITKTSVVDLTLTKIASREFGVFVPALNVSNKVKLSEIMPNKTFGDLVKAVMAWRNLDITVDINNQEVVMNKITKSINLPVSQDLRNTEVRFPTREPNENKSFLLQFEEKQDDLDYKKLLFSREGAQTEGFQRDENTQDINIGLFPVLNKTIDGLNTTYYEDNNEGVISIFFHDNATPTNASLDPTPLLIPGVFDEDHKDWLRFRLYSQTFKWSNVVTIEEALSLSVRKKSFAYNQNHFIKQLIVRIIDKDFTEVDIETEA